MLRAGETSRLSEPWFSPAALWRNVEATWREFARLGLLVLLPAALLGTPLRSFWARHGVALGAAAIVAWAWNGAFRDGAGAPLTLGAGGVVWAALAEWVWRQWVWKQRAWRRTGLRRLRRRAE